MKTYKKVFIVLVLVIVLGFTPLILILIPVFGTPNPRKSINIFMNYVDGMYFGVDYPVEGLEYQILDGSDVLISSGITDMTGMISFKIKKAWDLSGLGIHLVYNWSGIPQSLNNLDVGTYEQHVSLKGISSYIIWDDTLTPYTDEVELWYDGTWLLTFDLPVSGRLDISNYLIAGNYTLKGVFDDVFFEIPQNTTVYTEDIYVSAEKG